MFLFTAKRVQGNTNQLSCSYLLPNEAKGTPISCRIVGLLLYCDSLTVINPGLNADADADDTEYNMELIYDPRCRSVVSARPTGNADADADDNTIWS